MTFGYIPSIALFIYTCMLLVLLAARRNRIANSFTVLLVAMILWTGGSALMRDFAWLDYRIGYHISLLGLFMLPFGYHHFITEFGGKPNKLVDTLYMVIYGALYLINVPTGFFLAPPVKIGSGPDVTFVYESNWHVYFLYAILIVSIFYIFCVLISFSHKRREMGRQFRPIILGIILLFLGQFLVMVPLFRGFPIDIICGVINAFLILYALIKKRLFRLQLLADERLCYLIGLLLTFVLYFNLAPHFNKFLALRLPRLSTYYSLIFATCFLITMMFLTSLWKLLVQNVFIKDEIMQTEYLQNYSNTVSKSLRVKEIMEETIEVTKRITASDAVYICLKQADGSYRAAFSDRPLSDLHFQIRANNPLIEYLSGKGEGVLLREFRSSVSFKSMWEEEKKIFTDRRIVACIGLQDAEEMTGILLLSERKGRKNIERSHLQLMNSVCSVASIALKNARLYEKAYYEARTDELTGLLNRKCFLETLNEEFAKSKDATMSLAIINVDDFKLYNQLYGNRQGDLALQRIAEIIKASVGDSGYVARYTGKEFAVLLPKYDVYAAKNLVESVRKQIFFMNQGDGEYKLKSLTISAGISATPYAAKTVKELLNNVDMAVYHVKHQGKNGVQVFDVIVEDSMNLRAKNVAKTDAYHEYEATIYALTAAIDAKDHYTFNHSNNVAYYATELAKAMKLNPDIIEMLRQAALLHDVGKIGIPETILNKPGKLDDSEYSIIKGHVEASIGIIRHLPSLDYVIPAVIGHHERYDGKGYPRRIAGEDIPLTARILCVADSFDAMTSARCYKPPMPLEKALNIILEEAGTQFDPDLAYLFVKCFREGTIKLLQNETI